MDTADCESIPLTADLPFRVLRLLVRHVVRPGLAGIRSVAAQRRFVHATTAFGPRPRGTRVEPVLAGGVAAEWVVPPGPARGPLTLWLHGGGFCVGSPATHRQLAAWLAIATGGRVLVPDYRLAPEHAHPAALDDALAAWRWLRAGTTADVRLVLGGDSAGGWLALMAALRLRAAGEALPDALLLCSPLVDLTLESPAARALAARDLLVTPEWGRRMVGHYCGRHDRSAPGFAPLAQSLAGLPPVLIQAASEELLLDDARRLAAAARAAGVPVRLQCWEGLWHDWQMSAGTLPAGRRALAIAGAFARTACGIR